MPIPAIFLLATATNSLNLGVKNAPSETLIAGRWILRTIREASRSAGCSEHRCGSRGLFHGLMEFWQCGLLAFGTAASSHAGGARAWETLATRWHLHTTVGEGPNCGLKKSRRPLKGRTLVARQTGHRTTVRARDTS